MLKLWYHSMLQYNLHRIKIIYNFEYFILHGWDVIFFLKFKKKNILNKHVYLVCIHTRDVKTYQRANNEWALPL